MNISANQNHANQLSNSLGYSKNQWSLLQPIINSATNGVCMTDNHTLQTILQNEQIRQEIERLSALNERYRISNTLRKCFFCIALIIAAMVAIAGIIYATIGGDFNAFDTNAKVGLGLISCLVVLGGLSHIICKKANTSITVCKEDLTNNIRGLIEQNPLQDEQHAQPVPIIINVNNISQQSSSKDANASIRTQEDMEEGGVKVEPLTPRQINIARSNIVLAGI